MTFFGRVRCLFSGNHGNLLSAETNSILSVVIQYSIVCLSCFLVELVVVGRFVVSITLLNREIVTSLKS